MIRAMCEDLPVCLHLDKYADLYELPLVKFLEEIRLRYWLLTGHLYGCNNPDQIDKYWRHFLIFWARRFVSGNVRGSAYGEFMSEAHLPFVASVNTVEASQSSPNREEYSSIRIPSQSDIKQIRKGWLKDILTNATRILRSGRKDLAQKYIEDVLQAPVTTDRGTTLIEIDVMAPSRQLKADFEKLLKRLKDEPIFDKRIDSKISPARLRSLKVKKVFEQLDLRIIERVKGIKLSIADVARLTFPENKNDFEHFYKTFPRDYRGDADKACELSFIKQLEIHVSLGVERFS